MRPSLWTTAMASTLIAAAVCAQDTTRPRPESQPPSDRAPRPDAQPSDRTMDKSRDKVAADEPGPEHKQLEAFVGNWEMTGQCWEKPGGTAESVSGTAKSEWILGNRFVKSHVRGSKTGQSMEGIAMCGYDNGQRKYVSSWQDDKCTAIKMETGSYDTGTKTFTYTGESKDKNGQTVRCRRTVKINSDNEHVMTTYATESGKQEMKVAEITFKRSGTTAEIPNR
jgi:hypothetical protein